MNLAQDIMENQRGKGLSFARRIYLPRAVGLCIGSFSVAAALAPMNLPPWIWALLVLNAYIWPHIAYQLSSRADYPYKAELRNMLYDSLWGGFWAATVQFNPLTTVTVLGMMAMHNVAMGGLRLFAFGSLAQMAGILLGWLAGVRCRLQCGDHTDATLGLPAHAHALPFCGGHGQLPVGNQAGQTQTHPERPEPHRQPDRAAQPRCLERLAATAIPA
ncbi:membrane hypothetical protein [Pseudomonas sp. IT-P12]